MSVQRKMLAIASMVDAGARRWQAARTAAVAARRSNASPGYPRRLGRLGDLLGPMARTPPSGLFAHPEIAAAFRLRCNADLRHRPHPAKVHDAWAAMRLCINLLRTREDIRARFPRALSEGPDGAFARWLTSGGLGPRETSHDFRKAIAAAFDQRAAEQMRRIFAVRHDLKAEFPLALTPAGLPDFVLWLLNHGIDEHALRVEAIWWLAVECSEDPAGELLATYLVTPEWQRAHPDGLTVFGRRDLADWLAHRYRLTAGWAEPSRWPVAMTPAEQVRLGYARRDTWQSRHPDALGSPDRARALLRWLATPAAGLAADARRWCAGIDVE
ncbi:MAG: hypothetical protein M3Y41_21200, partial [Pseudomonadota bacterium]|nr:hypothetical protein [Pseudomonadota bacterium]